MVRIASGLSYVLPVEGLVREDIKLCRCLCRNVWKKYLIGFSPCSRHLHLLRMACPSSFFVQCRSKDHCKYSKRVCSSGLRGACSRGDKMVGSRWSSRSTTLVTLAFLWQYIMHALRSASFSCSYCVEVRVVGEQDSKGPSLVKAKFKVFSMSVWNGLSSNTELFNFHHPGPHATVWILRRSLSAL
jgi:hypothetical protein